jgi:hypothetical protein
VIDHRSVAQFDALSDEQVARAASLRVMMVDQSVGANVSEINGGHLGAAPAGVIRLAKSFWVLAASLAER